MIDYKILGVLISGDGVYRAYIGGSIHGHFVPGSAKDTYRESLVVGVAYQHEMLKAVDRGSRTAKSTQGSRTGK